MSTAPFNFCKNLKPGLHEPQQPVERNVALVSSIVVERRCCALKRSSQLAVEVRLNQALL